MASRTQITKLAREHGFESFERRGFLGFERVHADGRLQRMSIFSWSNEKVAAAQGIPSAYLVICPAVAADELAPDQEDARLRLPLVEWPATERQTRTWADVLAEFDTVIAPIFDLDEADGRALLLELPERYRLQ